MDAKNFRDTVADHDFTSSSRFLRHIVNWDMPSSTANGGFIDSPQLRALCVFLHYGAEQSYTKCVGCGAGACFSMYRRNDRDAYYIAWQCDTWQGAKCWASRLGTTSILKSIPQKHWMGFLHFVTLVKSDYRMKKFTPNSMTSMVPRIQRSTGGRRHTTAHWIPTCKRLREWTWVEWLRLWW